MDVRLNIDRHKHILQDSGEETKQKEEIKGIRIRIHWTVEKFGC